MVELGRKATPVAAYRDRGPAVIALVFSLSGLALLCAVSLALRVAQTYSDLSAQRRADLVKIDHNLGYLQSNTRLVSDEAMKQREALQRLNSYIVNVSQKVPQ